MYSSKQLWLIAKQLNSLDFLVQEYDYDRCWVFRSRPEYYLILNDDCILYFYKVHRYGDYPISFAQIYNDLPKEAQKKLLWHLDLFKRG